MEKTLQLILGKLDNLEQGQAKLEQGQAKLEQGQAKLEQGQERLEQRQAKLEQGHARLEQKLESGQEEILKAIRRIETSQQDDVVGMLKHITRKLDDTASKQDIQYLAAKIGVHDYEIDRLKKINALD